MRGKQFTERLPQRIRKIKQRTEAVDAKREAGRAQEEETDGKPLSSFPNAEVSQAVGPEISVRMVDKQSRHDLIIGGLRPGGDSLAKVGQTNATLAETNSTPCSSSLLLPSARLRFTIPSVQPNKLETLDDPQSGRDHRRRCPIHHVACPTAGQRQVKSADVESSQSDDFSFC